jgi:hypothetical protein
MAARKIKSTKGITIELWQTSFRVPGMSKTLSIGNDFQDEQVIQFVDELCDILEERATRSARHKLVQKAGSTLNAYLKELEQ